MTEDLGLKEAINQKVEAVGVAIIKDGKVLMVRNRAGTALGEGVWGLPAGKKKVHNPETDQEAAVRELREETGFDSVSESMLDFPGNYFEEDMSIFGEKRRVGWKVFVCDNYSGELLKERNNEVVPQWILLNRLQFYETAPNVLKVIQNAQEFIEGNKNV